MLAPLRELEGADCGKGNWRMARFRRRCTAAGKGKCKLEQFDEAVYL